MFHELLLSPGMSVVQLLPLTKNDCNIRKFIFENNIGGGQPKSPDKEVTQGRSHGRALKVWLWMTSEGAWCQLHNFSESLFPHLENRKIITTLQAT